MTKRVALYARYSDDLQNPRSVDDQLTLLREEAAARGLAITAEFTDRAISGASLLNRPGIQSLLTAARAGQFDMVLAEALDRISRDQEDTAGLFKRLTYADVAILTLAEGVISELHVGFKGTMNALFLKDLAAKVRRGQRGSAEAGRSAGGLCYGYDVVREINTRGEMVRGKRVINATQAAVIRRIFQEYASGRAPRAIAADLNRDSIPSPRGGHWNASTIGGNRARRNGILHNELYAGRLIYNRQSFRKDPETSRRIPRVNPRAQWIIFEAADLRIVPPDLWEAVQRLKARYAGLSVSRRRRPARLLSGLIVCGCCGAPYTMKDGKRLACTAHRESGTCRNGSTVVMSFVEAKVLEGVRDRLLTPEALASFTREFLAAQRAEAAEGERRRSEAARALQDATGRIDRIVRAIEDGTDSPAMRARLRQLEADRQRLHDEAAPPRAAVVALQPGLIDTYRDMVASLETALDSPAERQEAMDLLRALVERIVIYPGEGRGKYHADLHGRPALLAAMVSQGQPADPVVNMMVAAEGYTQLHHSRQPPFILRII